MRYEVRIIDAFTGHIFHPDGSGRVQRDGDIGFHETFESKAHALQRKDDLLRQPSITELTVTAEDMSEALVFRNEQLIQKIITERKAAYQKIHR